MSRATPDLLLLMVAGTICVVVVIAGLGVVMIELAHPEADTTQAVAGISGIVSTLIGLLAGFLAGRTRSRGGQRDEAA